MVTKKLTLKQLLLHTVKTEASDLHLCAGEIPAIRIKGEIQRLNAERLTAMDVRQLVDELMTDRQRSSFHSNLSVDFPFSFANVARFRCNAYMQSNGASIALRRIPAKILNGGYS